MLRVTPLGSQIGLLAWLAQGWVTRPGAAVELPSTPLPCARALTHGSVVGLWHRPDSCRSSLRAPLSFPLRPSLGRSATVAVPDGGAFPTAEGSQRLPALLLFFGVSPPERSSKTSPDLSPSRAGEGAPAKPIGSALGLFRLPGERIRRSLAQSFTIERWGKGPQRRRTSMTSTSRNLSRS